MKKKILQKKEYEAVKAELKWVHDTQAKVDAGIKVPFTEKQRWMITKKRLKKEGKL